MSEVRIKAEILDGNLGDGWKCNYAAAQALADYTTSVWSADIAEIRNDGHDVEIDVDVARATSGCSSEVSVDSNDWALCQRVERLLTPQSVIWDRFCSSEQAASLY